MRRLPDPAEALWTFRTRHLLVAFFAEPEDLDPAGSFDDPDDVARVNEGLESGDLAAWFSARVSVLLMDEDDEVLEELGRDDLGACSYRTLREFYTGHRTPDEAHRNTLANRARNLVYCEYFTDMVTQACAEARKALRARRDLYRQIRVREG